MSVITTTTITICIIWWWFHQIIKMLAVLIWLTIMHCLQWKQPVKMKGSLSREKRTPTRPVCDSLQIIRCIQMKNTASIAHNSYRNSAAVQEGSTHLGLCSPIITRVPASSHWAQSLLIINLPWRRAQICCMDMKEETCQVNLTIQSFTLMIFSLSKTATKLIKIKCYLPITNKV